MPIKIVDHPVTAGKAGKARYRTAICDGLSMRVRVVNADSPTFGADFESAFKANVRRVRKENRLLKVAG